MSRRKIIDSDAFTAMKESNPLLVSSAMVALAGKPYYFMPYVGGTAVTVHLLADWTMAIELYGKRYIIIKPCQSTIQLSKSYNSEPVNCRVKRLQAFMHMAYCIDNGLGMDSQDSSTCDLVPVFAEISSSSEFDVEAFIKSPHRPRTWGGLTVLLERLNDLDHKHTYITGLMAMTSKAALSTGRFLLSCVVRSDITPDVIEYTVGEMAFSEASTAAVAEIALNYMAGNHYHAMNLESAFRHGRGLSTQDVNVMMKNSLMVDRTYDVVEMGGGRSMTSLPVPQGKRLVDVVTDGGSDVGWFDIGKAVDAMMMTSAAEYAPLPGLR